MKKLLRITLVALGLIVVLGGGLFAWASIRASSLTAQVVTTHTVDFPIPFPLTSAERGSLAAGSNSQTVALERAVERGRHLVEARYACTECHGDNMAGGVMVDDPLIGQLVGPNLTSGEGSLAVGYTTADWDRAVRHGVAPDGRPLLMPVQDFQSMSDQELSDLVAYIRSLPPMFGETPESKLGPLGKILVATGQMPIPADQLSSHLEEHPEIPPPATPTVEFGAHLAAVCVGCHGAALAGGRVVGGDPSWPPASNLTPHVEGIAGWTFEEFDRTMRQGRRLDDSPLQPPMSDVVAFTANMTETEMRALWAYLRTLPPQPTP